MLTVCSLCIMSICSFSFSHFGFEDSTLVLIAPAPCHCLPFTVYTDDMAENAKPEKNCKGLWIEFHKHVTTLTSQSVQKHYGSEPAPGKPYIDITLSVNGKRLQVFDNFASLHSSAHW